MTDLDPQVIEQAAMAMWERHAREGECLVGYSSGYTWETIPDSTRNRFRDIIRAAYPILTAPLRALLEETVLVSTAGLALANANTREAMARLATAEARVKELEGPVKDAYYEGFNAGVKAAHGLSARAERDIDGQWRNSDACAALTED